MKKRNIRVRLSEYNSDANWKLEEASCYENNSTIYFQGFISYENKSEDEKTINDRLNSVSVFLLWKNDENEMLKVTMAYSHYKVDGRNTILAFDTINMHNDELLEDITRMDFVITSSGGYYWDRNIAPKWDLD